MSLPFVRQFRYEHLVSLLLGAGGDVIYGAPGVHPEVAEALKEAAARGCAVRVVLDPSEAAIRNGFGEARAVAALLDAGIDVRAVPGLQMGFVLTDSEAYFLFPQSRALVEDGAGDNAVAMDALAAERLRIHFFPPEDYEAHLASATRIAAATEAADEREHAAMDDLGAAVKREDTPTLDREAFEATKEKLAANPPLTPDLKRQISVYTHKLQFVELEFRGADFTSTTVRLPEHAIPVANRDLRESLQSRLKLFGDADDLREREELAPYFAFKDEVERIRKTHFVHVPSRKKNVISLARKAEIQRDLDGLRQRLDGLRGDIVQLVKEETMRTRRRLRKELERIYRQNPEPDYATLQGDLFEEAVESRAHQAILDAKFPDAEALVGRFALWYRFFDLTWEDFSDPEFIEELHARGLIPRQDVTELRALRSAYETQPSESL